jgi:hypothetical protein
MQDANVDLWATDEVHFQQHGSRCRMWIPPEIKDPVLLHAPTQCRGLDAPRTVVAKIVARALKTPR